MNKELKQAITNFIFENEKEFQINNATTDKFRAYIYDSDGNYLMGGVDVANFIHDIINLLQNKII